jgi:2-phosphosulfolactate phosphatase
VSIPDTILQDARFVTTADAATARGAVVVVDVLRAFTTAAYAFAAGARWIWIVGTVDEALAMKTAHPSILAMGEEHGHRPVGFDFSNSPAVLMAPSVDLRDRVIVQRTSAGTQGVVAARAATRLWCASLVVGSATAAAVRAASLGAPTYVLTGHIPERGLASGADDRATAELIERARLRHPLDADRTAREVASSEEAALTLAHGPSSAPPEDIALATQVDRFDFAMEAIRTVDGIRLERREPGR